jgi:multiple sugar transport system permease protein
MKNAAFDKSKKNIPNKKDIIGWLFSTPYFIYGIVFFLIPLIWAIWLSTMDWNLMSFNRNFVGLQNFISAIGDEKVRAAFLNSFKYMAVLLPAVLIFSTAIALLLSKLPKSIKGIYSVSFFIPYLTSSVAISVVVRYFFSYSSIFNVFLREKCNLDINWFQSPFWAFSIIVGLIVWKIAGYYALIILAALESVPQEIYDAAAVDGVTGFKKYIYITLPIILSSMTTVIVLVTGLIFGIFSEPYLLTSGGPLLATTTWHLELFNASFVRFDSGFGAAIAILNAIQIFISIRLITMIMDKFDYNSN